MPSERSPSTTILDAPAEAETIELAQEDEIEGVVATTSPDGN